MKQECTTSSNEGEELNVWELLDHIKVGWRWIAGGAVAGLVGAVGFVMVVPPQYEASAVIQTATVGSAAAGSSTKGAEVEPVAQTLERMKLATFYTNDLLNACDVKSLSNPRQALSNAIKPTLVKGNSLIQVSYRAKSVEVAEACLAAVLDQLAKTQEAIAAPIIKTLREQYNLTKAQLDEAERFQRVIEKRAMALDPSDTKFSQSMLMLNAALSKREEISKLRKLFIDQGVQLSEPLTQGAKLLEPIYASDRAIFPKKTLTVVGGLVGGFFAGLLALYVNRSWRRYVSSGSKIAKG